MKNPLTNNHLIFLIKIFLMIVCLFWVDLAFAANPYQLVFAADVIRHGDRTPAIILPNDSHAWQEGLDQLTPKGASQLYAIGKSLRNIYIEQYHLLPPHYKTNTIYVRSSDFDRTLMSAQALLFGLYPLGTGPILNNDSFALPQGYQPIPVHTVDVKQDDLLLPSNVNPQPFQTLLKQYVYSQPDWLAKEKSVQPQLIRWSQQTGYKMNQLKDIVPLGDALYVARLDDLPPPSGMNKDEIDEIINLEQWVVASKFKPKPIGQFLAQPFWIKLAHDMQEIMAGNQQAPSYTLYLGHDATILGLLSALGVPSQTVPDYGDDLQFELLKDQQKQFWVRVNYRHQIIKIPGCGNLCSVNQFFSRVD